MKRILLSLLLLLNLGGVVFLPATVHAQGTKSAICEGIGAAGGGANCTPTNSDGSPSRSVDDILKTVLNLFSVVIGIAAVFMIMFGGFRYVTSAGDAGKLSSAKDTILYAIVGLVVVAFAQIIVRFVLTKVK